MYLLIREENAMRLQTENNHKVNSFKGIGNNACTFYGGVVNIENRGDMVSLNKSVCSFIVNLRSTQTGCTQSRLTLML